MKSQQNSHADNAQSSEDTTKYQPRCDAPQDREESDLCAQWEGVAAARQANSLAAESIAGARDANAVSAETLWWTRAGILAIVATLIATAWAAWAAWAASAAAKAANVSLDLFQKNEAGFLIPSVEFAAAPTSSGTALKVSFINRGRSPVAADQNSAITRSHELGKRSSPDPIRR